MFAFILVWGNSVPLVEIFPVVGGAIGGFISAIFAMISLFLSKQVKNPLYKVLIGIGFFALNILACWGVAELILSIAA